MRKAIEGMKDNGEPLSIGDPLVDKDLVNLLFRQTHYLNESGMTQKEAVDNVITKKVSLLSMVPRQW